MEVYVVGDIADLGKSGSVSLDLGAKATVENVVQAIESEKHIPKSKQVSSFVVHCIFVSLLLLMLLMLLLLLCADIFVSVYILLCLM